MEEQLGTVTVAVRADVTTLDRDFAQAKAQAASFDKSLARTSPTANKVRADMTLMGASTKRALDSSTAATTRLETRFATLGRTAVRSIGLMVGITGIAGLGKVILDTVHEADRLQDVARKIGLTTDALQELEFAGRQANVEVGAMDDALSRFGKNLGEASRGSGDLAKVLTANNVAIRDAQGNIRPTNDLLGDFADLVKNASSEQEQLLLTTMAFGRGSDDLVLALKGGKTALAGWADQARRTGQVIEGDLIEKTAPLAKRWDNLMQSMTKGFQTFVLSIVDGTATAAGTLTKFLDDLQKKGGIELIPGTGIKFGTGIDPIDKAVNDAIAQSEQGKGKADADPLGIAKVRAVAELQKQLFDIQHAVRTIVPAAGDEEAAKRIQDTITALNQETTALGLSGQALAEYEALTQAGITANNAMAGAVTAAADANYRAQESVKAATAQQKKLTDAIEFTKDSFRGFIGDLASGLRQGESLWRSFTDGALNLLDKIINKLEDVAVEALFSLGSINGTRGAGAGGGIIGALVKGTQSLLGVTAHSGGVVGEMGIATRRMPVGSLPRLHYGGMLRSDEVPAILQRGETVLPRGMRGMMQGGKVEVVIHTTSSPYFDQRVDARSAGVAVQVVNATDKQKQRAAATSQ